MNLLTSKKIRILAEITVGFFLLHVFGFVFNGIADALHVNGLWVGVAIYLACAAIIIFYVKKVEKKPLASIGLKAPVLADIPKGLLLGLCMFIVQQIPMVLMKYDYSVLAAAPDWGHIILMSLYCFLCVGFVEELIFRGFILQKTQELCRLKVVIIAINCLLFYAVHWPPVRFVFGEFFNIAVNTLFWCIYFYTSKNKSIIPLAVAHGFYDILVSFLMPTFLFTINK